ncbi:MAG: hypothetical protein ACR2NL_05190 [Acidimicrobiia bacterium]
MRTNKVVTSHRMVAIAVATCALLLSACSDGDEASPSDLLGTWDATNASAVWVITDDVIASTFGGGIETSYTATATTVELGDDVGERACPPGQVGVYEWVIEDDVLTMTLVSDDCGGRGGVIGGISLERTG